MRRETNTNWNEMSEISVKVTVWLYGKCTLLPINCPK